MKKLYVILAIAFGISCVTYSAAQSSNFSLPSGVQTILNKKHKNWKLVTNPCKTATTGDFNGDDKTDYILLVTTQRNGSLLGFVSNGSEFRLISIKDLDKRDAELMAIAPIAKNAETTINRRAVEIESDGFTLTTCGYNDNQHYILKDGNFVELSEYLIEKSNQIRSGDEFNVKGPKPWLDTGIDVQQGCIVILDPRGKVDVSAGWGVHDAYGTEKYYPNFNYPVNSNFRYGLAAQITPNLTARDRNRDAWIYEYEGTHTAKRSGRLWLVVNDDNPQDNSGEFRVRVRISCDY